MLFNPDNIIDRSIFNEILEEKIGSKNNIPKFGLFKKLRYFNEAELVHLKKMLSHDKIMLFNKWGILEKPEVNENNSPDFLLSEKLVTKVNLRNYLPTRTDINWDQWLKSIFAPYADIKLFMQDPSLDRVTFVVALEHNKPLPLHYNRGSGIGFNMYASGLLLDHPHIYFSVRGPNRNGSSYGYYLNTQSSVLEFDIEDIQCLEKDFDKRWQEISLDLTQLVTTIFERGIDYEENYEFDDGPCISWKNDRFDLLEQMKSLAKWWSIDYTADEEYFKKTTLNEPNLNESATKKSTLNVATPSSYGLFSPSSAADRKTPMHMCPGCNVM